MFGEAAGPAAGAASQVLVHVGTRCRQRCLFLTIPTGPVAALGGSQCRPAGAKASEHLPRACLPSAHALRWSVCSRLMSTFSVGCLSVCLSVSRVTREFVPAPDVSARAGAGRRAFPPSSRPAAALRPASLGRAQRKVFKLSPRFHLRTFPFRIMLCQVRERLLSRGSRGSPPPEFVSSRSDSFTLSMEVLAALRAKFGGSELGAQGSALP